MWLTLIPQTMMERLLMAGGICLFYLLFANLWNLARQKKLVPEVFQLEKKYLLN
jgi:TRAP-type C4-dicarboxylate transport system permease small subunit